MECFIRLIRDPDVEDLVQNVDPPKRKSARLLKMEEDAKQKTIVSNKSHQSANGKPAINRSVNNRNNRMPNVNRTLNNRTPKKIQGSPNAEIMRSAGIPKSIMKSAHRLRGRSKSVTFDVGFASPTIQQTSSPVCRNLFGRNAASSVSSAQSSTNGNDLPIDLTTTGAVKAASELTNNAEMPTNESVDALASGVSSEISSGDKLAFENRIESLIQSNRSKIGRIKELLSERQTLLSQIEDLHRINHSLTQTVDLFRAEDENGDPLKASDEAIKWQEETKQLKVKVGLLRDRLDRSNRQNFVLKEENEKMKATLSSYSKKVLTEHNYNL